MSASPYLKHSLTASTHLRPGNWLKDSEISTKPGKHLHEYSFSASTQTLLTLQSTLYFFGLEHSLTLALQTLPT